jgi:hypothetical protein
MVHLSCKNADGLGDNTTQIISAVWSEFTDLDVRRVDGVQLAYYRTSTCNITGSAGLIQNGEGQCGSWARLFIDLLLVQGIDNRAGFTIVKPSDSTEMGFIVKNWNFIGSGTSGIPSYPWLNIGVAPLYLTASLNFKYQEVVDVIGISGQGNSNPLSFFGNHQIVKIGSVYYDPSYGRTYSSIGNMDDVAIEGYNKLSLTTANEPDYGVDFNGDGDTNDMNVPVIKLIFRKNPAGNNLVAVPGGY